MDSAVSVVNKNVTSTTRSVFLLFKKPDFYS
jgi:hypothetical protein